MKFTPEQIKIIRCALEHAYEQCLDGEMYTSANEYSELGTYMDEQEEKDDESNN